MGSSFSIKMQLVMLLTLRAKSSFESGFFNMQAHISLWLRKPDSKLPHPERIPPGHLSQ